MDTEYRVVFSGAVLDGFDIDTVRQDAGVRLKASAEQLDRLFSGRPAILKKGLDKATGERYLKELVRIGMNAKLEPVAQASPSAPPKVPVQLPSDLEKTQLANTDTLARYLVDQPDPASAPTLVVPRTDIPANTIQSFTNPASAPTLIVPRDKLAETRQQLEQALAAENPSSAPTLIVPRDKLADTRLQMAQDLAAITDPSSAPTLIVPRSSVGSSSTVVIQQGADHLRSTLSGKHDPERTLIANPDALEAYLTANTDASPMGDMRSTNIQQSEQLDHAEHTPAPQHQEVARDSARHSRERAKAVLQEQIAASAEPMRPFQAQAAIEAKPLAQQTRRTDESEETTNNPSQEGLSPMAQLLLASLAGGVLLVGIVWFLG